MPEYDDLDFKIPVEAKDYPECSQFVTDTIGAIIKDAIDQKHNKIIINTNLKLGLPMENINKIAGPFVEAWAVQTFHTVLEDSKNRYQLINVEAKERLYMADVILQFKRERKADTAITAEVDVKATAEDIKKSGKSPNITSFRRIRTAYVTDPDYMFIILSLKHKVHCKRNETSGLMDGIMEVVSYNAYDLKYLSPRDLNFNPALGSGQIQVADIRYVSLEKRTTWEFCQLLDRKYLSSRKRSLEHWINLAKELKWIKYE
ncbi:MAG: restriction endonuclease [Phycisphaerae bacterium]